MSDKKQYKNRKLYYIRREHIAAYPRWCNHAIFITLFLDDFQFFAWKTKRNSSAKSCSLSSFCRNWRKKIKNIFMEVQSNWKLCFPRRRKSNFFLLRFKWMNNCMKWRTNIWNSHCSLQREYVIEEKQVEKMEKNRAK